MTFDGRELVVDSGGTKKSFSAVSGDTAKGFEPIPKGKYWIQPSELWTRGTFNNSALCIASLFLDKTCDEVIAGHKAAWGDQRVTIHPYAKTEVGERGGFFIHGGATFGSAGCIDLAGGMGGFVEHVNGLLGKGTANCHIDLEVK